MPDNFPEVNTLDGQLQDTGQQNNTSQLSHSGQQNITGKNKVTLNNSPTPFLALEKFKLASYGEELFYISLMAKYDPGMFSLQTVRLYEKICVEKNKDHSKRQTMP